MPEKPKTKKRARAEGDDERARAGGDSLNAYIREIAKFRPLSLEEEKDLGRRIKNGDEKAVQSMVEANLRFVVSYAKRYRGLGLAFLDLIHEGNLGLMEAAKRFDPERNVKFISYAVWWVRQAIFHALSEHARVFRLPQKLSGQVSRLQKLRDSMAEELRRSPTSAELAEKSELSEEQVDVLLRAGGDDVSLSSSVGDDGGLEFGDTLEQETIPSAELELIRTSFESQIQAMVAELLPKEREVIRLRFGLDGEESKTLQEIGDALGLSRERVRQIESKAKEKLRRSREAQGLRGYLN
ncbi:MAG TPA: RNA polymerase sigma factor RpoD/SigA [Vicinamibacteria bacterium]